MQKLTSQERVLIESLVDRRDELVKTLKEWSLQNSGSKNRDGLAKMRALLKLRFASLNGEISDVKLPDVEAIDSRGQKVKTEFEPSVLIRVRPEAATQLVLTGHYDTVFPENSDFQNFQYIDDDTLNGPGMADMKGGILVMHAALETFEQYEFANSVGYSILLSPDEEIGSPGSAPILARLGRQSHIGLTYEPSLADGSMAGARKGSGNFSVTVRGRAAHAGREHHLGRNAINAVAEFAIQLNNLNGQRDGVTFNLSKIDGGGAVNIVPDLAIGRFNVRMLETEDMAWIEQSINKLINHIHAQDGLSAELHGGFTRPPKPMAPANAMVFDWVKQAGALLGQDIRWTPSGGVCEGNNLWASGCPNVDTLGVRGGEIHSDREFIKLSSLVERSQLSAIILMKIASGEFNAQEAKALVEGATC